MSRYFLSYVSFRYYSTSAQIAYRLAFLSAAATYGIVVYKQYVARGLAQGGARSLLPRLVTDENVQYLGEFRICLSPGNAPRNLTLMIFLCFRNGVVMVEFPPDSSGSSAVHRVLRLSRCDLHQIVPNTHFPAQQARCRSECFQSVFQLGFSVVP